MKLPDHQKWAQVRDPPLAPRRGGPMASVSLSLGADRLARRLSEIFRKRYICLYKLALYLQNPCKSASSKEVNILYLMENFVFYLIPYESFFQSNHCSSFRYIFLLY